MEPLSNILSHHQQNPYPSIPSPSSVSQLSTNDQNGFIATERTFEQISQPAIPHNETLNNQQSSLPERTPEQTLAVVKTIIYSLREQLDILLRIVSGEQKISTTMPKLAAKQDANSGRVIEGVFNGVKMIGPDGKEYHVPPNYASKSKLVEGDMMKLTIMPNGAFVYKQICPIPRKRIVGALSLNEASSQWTVTAEEKPYKVLTASVTFYRGKHGDEAVILIPQEGGSEWGAVENIICK